MLWLKLAAGALALVVVIVAVADLYGAWRWDAGTRALRARLDAARQSAHPARVDARELERLPAPVQRYFRAVPKDCQPMVAAARLEHAGTFNVSEAGEQWKAFTSTQYVVTQRPGFDWDGRSAMVPGAAGACARRVRGGRGHPARDPARARDACRAARHAGDGRGRADYLAEAPWYPTALLPSQGVRWEPVNESSALATLGDGEVAWLLPGGAKAYWRGRLTRLQYEHGD